MVAAFAVWVIFHCNQWSTTGQSKDEGMCSPVCRKVHIKDPLLLIGKTSLCGDNGVPLKKYVTITICLMSNS